MPTFDRPPDAKTEYRVVPEGKHKARLVDITSARNRNGKPYTGVKYEIHAPDEDYNRYQIELQLYDTDRAYNFAFARMLEVLNMNYEEFMTKNAQDRLTDYTEILLLAKVKGQWYDVKVEHKARQGDPDKPHANITRVRLAEQPFDPTPKSVPAPAPVQAPAQPSGVGLEEPF